MNNETLKQLADNYLPLLIVLASWEAIWKLLGMWKAGRSNHLGWFICIALINTVGILPIVYLILQRKKTVSS